MKKRILFVLLILVILFQTISFTSEIDYKRINIENAKDYGFTYIPYKEDDEILRNVSCLMGGNCDAASRGYAWVVNYLTNQLYFEGACHQCTKCERVFATQNDPRFNTPIGFWCSREWIGSVGPYTLIEAASVSYTNFSYIPGVEFR